MKIRLTVEVQANKGDDFKRAQELLRMAQKGIVEKFSSRLKTVGTGYMDSYGGSASSTIIEVEDEEPKTVSDSGVC